MTLIYYIIVGIWAFPNIQTFFNLLEKVQRNEFEMSFKRYFLYLRKNLKTGLGTGMICMSIVSIALFEVSIILNNKQLIVLLPLFLIFLVLFIASTLNMLVMSTMGGFKYLNNIKLSLFLGWKNVLKSLVVCCLFLLWLSFGYYIPILNVLVGNLIFLWLIYYIMNNSIKKMTFHGAAGQ